MNRKYFQDFTLKRLNKECITLRYNAYIYNIVTTQSVIKLYIPFKDGTKAIICIQLCYDYPFKCPKIFINDKEYISILAEVSASEKLDSECLCCKSICCHNTWKPCYNIKNILDEIKYFEEIDFDCLT